MRLLISLLVFGAALPVTAQESELAAPAVEAQSKPPVLDAADAAALPPHAGKPVIIAGTVAEVATSSAGNVRITFTGGAVSLYIKKADLGAELKPADWKGRPVFAGGVLGTYRGQWQITVTRAAQVADSPDKIDPAAFPAAAAPEVPAGPAPKLERVAYIQMRADFSGDEPLLHMERMEAAFARATGNTTVKVEPYSQKARAAADAAASAWKAARPGAWPAGQALSFRRVQGAETGSEPAGFGAMLAAEALMQGLIWPDALMVAGRAAPTGRPAGGANEVHLLPQSVIPSGLWLLVPASAEPALRDLLLDGASPSLTRLHIFAAADLDGAVSILKALGSPETRAALKTFDDVCAPLLTKEGAAKAAETVKSAGFRTKMAAVSKALPWHLSARLLAAPTPAADAPYSLSGSAVRLCSFLTSARPALLALTAKEVDSEAKKSLRDLTTQWRALQSRAHPQWLPVTRKIDDAMEAAKTFLNTRGERTSTKVKAAATALRNAVKEAERATIKAENYTEPGL